MSKAVRDLICYPVSKSPIWCITHRGRKRCAVMKGPRPVIIDGLKTLPERIGRPCMLRKLRSLRRCWWQKLNEERAKLILHAKVARDHLSHLLHEQLSAKRKKQLLQFRPILGSTKSIQGG